MNIEPPPTGRSRDQPNVKVVEDAMLAEAYGSTASDANVDVNGRDDDCHEVKALLSNSSNKTNKNKKQKLEAFLEYTAQVFTPEESSTLEDGDVDNIQIVEVQIVETEKDDDFDNNDEDDDSYEDEHFDSRGLFVPGGFTRDHALDNVVAACAPPIIDVTKLVGSDFI
jgi:hypothetical protein